MIAINHYYVFLTFSNHRWSTLLTTTMVSSPTFSTRARLSTLASPTTLLSSSSPTSLTMADTTKRWPRLVNRILLWIFILSLLYHFIFTMVSVLFFMFHDNCCILLKKYMYIFLKRFLLTLNYDFFDDQKTSSLTMLIQLTTIIINALFDSNPEIRVQLIL